MSSARNSTRPRARPRRAPSGPRPVSSRSSYRRSPTTGTFSEADLALPSPILEHSDLPPQLFTPSHSARPSLDRPQLALCIPGTPSAFKSKKNKRATAKANAMSRRASTTSVASQFFDVGTLPTTPGLGLDMLMDKFEELVREQRERAQAQAVSSVSGSGAGSAVAAVAPASLAVSHDDDRKRSSALSSTTTSTPFEHDLQQRDREQAAATNDGLLGARAFDSRHASFMSIASHFTVELGTLAGGLEMETLREQFELLMQENREMGKAKRQQSKESVLDQQPQLSLGDNDTDSDASSLSEYSTSSSRRHSRPESFTSMSSGDIPQPPKPEPVQAAQAREEQEYDEEESDDEPIAPLATCSTPVQKAKVGRTMSMRVRTKRTYTRDRERPKLILTPPTGAYGPPPSFYPASVSNSSSAAPTSPSAAKPRSPIGPPARAPPPMMTPGAGPSSPIKSVPAPFFAAGAGPSSSAQAQAQILSPTIARSPSVMSPTLRSPSMLTSPSLRSPSMYSASPAPMRITPLALTAASVSLRSVSASTAVTSPKMPTLKVPTPTRSAVSLPIPAILQPTPSVSANAYHSWETVQPPASSSSSAPATPPYVSASSLALVPNRPKFDIDASEPAEKEASKGGKNKLGKWLKERLPLRGGARPRVLSMG